MKQGFSNATRGSRSRSALGLNRMLKRMTQTNRPPRLAADGPTRAREDSRSPNQLMIPHSGQGGSPHSGQGGAAPPGRSNPRIVLAQTDALGNRIATHRDFDEKGRLEAIIDPLGNTVRFTWDELDRLVAITDPLKRVRTYE
ncbi:MAG: RHS repeat protein [Deltaproteobacteria bacterium]|nr:RHS repeat protein [Deltaproteobacteria bacterium]